MLIRIVRMTFQPDKTADFLAIFQAAKENIRYFEGCRYLALLHDADNPAVYYTYSLWDSPEHLARYRRSEVFRTTWQAIKRLFADKPQAFSLFQLEEL
ncbi:MAG: antibiotic biosynthesis monooxygenase family protein [Cytophagales bacterium]|nr:antibiotic biosynthesis monooxygenase [Bernardetiaceae bacterium]MDW8210973.1 antibiotic biosynthesis monooxygenase family protein [Cytophagales bacterium]